MRGTCSKRIGLHRTRVDRKSLEHADLLNEENHKDMEQVRFSTVSKPRRAHGNAVGRKISFARLAGTVH
jgi:hypothetical protein